MQVTWDPKISLGQVITLGTVVAAVVAGGFSFYYKSNTTSEKVSDLAKKIEEISTDVKLLDKSVADNDKNMTLRIDSSTQGVKQDINLMRTEVVKIATEQSGMQRQIEEMKDDIRDLDTQ